MDFENQVQLPQNPIVLTPGREASSEAIIKEKNRGFATTFAILFSGWLFGNLILLTILSCIGVFLAASTGLVKVPLLSNFLFGKATIVVNTTNNTALQSAQDKISEISSLSSGQTLKELDLSENEINALFIKQAQSASDFPVVDPNLKLAEGQFIFSGKLVNTNAPINIEGKISVNGLTADVSVTAAKFGKFNLPSFIATNIVESNLSKIGLSLSGSQIPAKNLKIENGQVSLQNVSNPKAN